MMAANDDHANSIASPDAFKMLMPQAWPPMQEWPEPVELATNLAGLFGLFAIACAEVGRTAKDVGQTAAWATLAAAEQECMKNGLWSQAHSVLSFWAKHAIIQATSRSEFALQEHLRQNLSRYIPDAISEPVKGKAGKGLCDLLVVRDGERAPMEVKLGSFGDKAKTQLRRYMIFYGAQIGYAAADKLTCELDEDMQFVCTVGWDAHLL